MDDIKALVAHRDEGGRISFGQHVVLVEDTLHLPGRSLPLNTLEKLCQDAGGNVLVHRLGSDAPPILVPATEVEDVDRFIHVINHFVQAIPYVQRRSTTGWPPGSVGDISVRIGTDVRDLLIVGYSHEQTGGLLRGEYALDELYRQRPKGKPVTLRAQRS